ncbi:unnamed protein product, partial [Effrenium voratum]
MARSQLRRGVASALAAAIAAKLAARRRLSCDSLDSDGLGALSPTLREHTIDTEAGPPLTVKLWESALPFAGGPGLRSWPSARHLLTYLRDLEPKEPRFRRKVLELGCGCGLLAFALGLLGAEVTATDQSEEALTLCAKSATERRARGLRLAFRRLDWTDSKACRELLK